MATPWAFHGQPRGPHGPGPKGPRSYIGKLPINPLNGGDMLIWDNRCALHQAYQDYDLSQERVLHRVILHGERPFGPSMPRVA